MADKAFSAEDIAELLSGEIAAWHVRAAGRLPEDEIVPPAAREIRRHGEHRESLPDAARELAAVNTEMWHEEDKVRSADDAVVLRAIRNINPLNQRRNDLIEEIDEIMSDTAKGGADSGDSGEPHR